MVTQYRVVVLGLPRGPWRLIKAQAHRDAIELELGEYDERGRFWIRMPGDIQYRQVKASESHITW